MIKKISKISLIALFSCCSFAHAGMMGETMGTPFLSSFLSLEGGYTWNQIKGYNFNLIGLDGHFYSHENNLGGTGRLGAGFMRNISDRFALSTEIGYGYYGRTTETPILTGAAGGIPASLTLKYNLSGLDVLAGVDYIDPSWGYSLFLKAGGLVQNLDTKSFANFTPLGISTINVSNQTLNHTGVLPELKVGGAYYLDDNWAFTLAYMHAFGASPRTTGTFNVTTGSAFFHSNQQNPTLSSVLAGIQFKI